MALLFVLIGYSSYMVIPIRSTYNPPLDENDPEEVMSFVSYLKREQYGDRPLLYGPTIKSKVVAQEKGDAKYRKLDGEYKIYDYKVVNEYDKKHNMLLPRIHSSQQNHKAMYKRWVNIPKGDRKISMKTNLEYLFKYQVGFMFWRYFFWNLVDVRTTTKTHTIFTLGRLTKTYHILWSTVWQETNSICSHSF